MPCASRSHPLAIAIAVSMTRPGPRRCHCSSPATSRSQFQFECCKRTPVKLIRFRFICKKTSLGGRKQKEKKKRRLIFRGGFVCNLRTMLCTPLSSPSLCDACSRRNCQDCAVLLRQTANEILDRLTVGVRDDETRHKLLAKTYLTLDEAVDICRAEEAATQTRSDISLPGNITVNAARKKSTYQH